jgi:hypothetical protein
MGGEPSLFNPGDEAPNDGVYMLLFCDIVRV